MGEDRLDRFSEVAAETFVARTCFKTGPPQAYGIELEWLLHHRGDQRRQLTTEDLAAARSAADGLADSTFSLEPGGQVELSSPPVIDPATCLRAVRSDLEPFRERLSAAGLTLTGVGLDPLRRPRRLLSTPRYVAMERYFDRRGPAGRRMMCGTAALQINVDAGPELPTAGQVDVVTRWELLHELVPVLIAAFANSPVVDGHPTGLRCTRQAVWRAIDPGRTRPVLRPGEDPRESWTRYALDAGVLCILGSGSEWAVPSGLTLRAWARGGGPRELTGEDVAYHLTTLFPPVRPRGSLELRVIDAQRTDGDWAAALAFVAALVSDPIAVDAARAALADLAAEEKATVRAARDGLSDPTIAAATRACFAAAHEAAQRAGPGAGGAALADFAERYVERGRCPADDTLAEFLTGSREELPCRATA